MKLGKNITDPGSCLNANWEKMGMSTQVQRDDLKRRCIYIGFNASTALGVIKDYPGPSTFKFTLKSHFMDSWVTLFFKFLLPVWIRASKPWKTFCFLPLFSGIFFHFCQAAGLQLFYYQLSPYPKNMPNHWKKIKSSPLGYWQIVVVVVFYS